MPWDEHGLSSLVSGQLQQVHNVTIAVAVDIDFTLSSQVNEPVYC